MQRRIRQLKGRFLLDVVIRQGSTIFELLASENQSLLIRWNTLYFVLRLEGGKGEEDEEHNKRKRSAENPGSNKKPRVDPSSNSSGELSSTFSNCSLATPPDVHMESPLAEPAAPPVIEPAAPPVLEREAVVPAPVAPEMPVNVAVQINRPLTPPPAGGMIWNTRNVNNMHIYSAEHRKESIRNRARVNMQYPPPHHQTNISVAVAAVAVFVSIDIVFFLSS